MNASPTRPGSFLLTRELAQRAIERVAAVLDDATRDPHVNQGGFCHVVVMDPARRPGEAAFEDAILLEHSCGGPRDAWDADYAGFARAKARLSWEHGCDSGVLQQQRPWLLREGDTTLWGSVWLDGLVVSVSGGEAEFDEAFAGMVAMLLRAETKLAARTRERQLYLGR